MKNVAVTGVGLISGLGRGLAAHAKAFREGRTGFAANRLFALEGIPASPVALVDEAWLVAADRVGRSERLALTAATDALGATRLSGDGVLAFGTTTGGIYESEQHYAKHRGKAGAEDRGLLRHHSAGSIADRVAKVLGLAGERHTFSTACSSSANALGYAAARIVAGAPWALAGGVDSLSRLTYAGFFALKLLSERACQPFDKARVGLNLGEAAAFLVLEPADRARARGARIWGYVGGWGCAADAHHMTAPHPEGKGAIAAMRLALADAGVPPSQVDYVNAHGTATPANDKAEALALRAVFGDAMPPVSSTKGATGHTLGAAGALEAAFCLLAMQEGHLPATASLLEPDPAAQVNHVPRGGLERQVRVALSNSFGFGGNNAALVLTAQERP